MQVKVTLDKILMTANFLSKMTPGTVDDRIVGFLTELTQQPLVMKALEAMDAGKTSSEVMEIMFPPVE